MQTEVAADYKVIFSKRRTLRITVERDGVVVVRAPQGTSREEVERIVQRKRQWIREKVSHPQKYKVGPEPPGKELVSGESMLYLGRTYRVEIVDSISSSITFDHKFLVPRGLAERGRDEFRKWYVGRAGERLIPRAWDWAERLGVEPTGVSIVDTQYRWGSCSPSGHVRLNWRLIKAPASVADYVIVHEMAHLLEAAHSDRFTSIIRSQVPRMEASRAWLREQGQLLEQDL